MDRRTAFQRARDFWGTLNDDQYLAWKTLASTRQTHPVLGQSGNLSGYELAVQINVHLATVGLPMLPNPSPVPVFPANPVLGLDITRADGDVSLKLPLSAQPAQYIVVLGAKPRSPGVSYVDHYRILGLVPDPEGGLSDITDLFRDTFTCCPPASASLSKLCSKSTAGATCPKPSPPASPPSRPGGGINRPKAPGFQPVMGK